VLEDNYYQTQALSVGGHTARRLLEQQQRFIRFLEKEGRLNRALEFLPDDETIAERRAAGLALTAPERAVLLAYAKMWLYDALLASDLPEDPWARRALAHYFPERLRKPYAQDIERHPLLREIIATRLTNTVVNRVGSTFVHQAGSATGAAPAQIVRAFLLVREIFDLNATWSAIEALDNQVADDTQSRMLIELGRRTGRATAWFLRSRRLAEPMGDVIERFGSAAKALRQVIADAPPAAPWRAAIEPLRQELVSQRVPEALAMEVAIAGTLLAALDLAEVAETAKQPLPAVAATYFALGETLGLARLRTQVAALPAEGYWQLLAKTAISDDLAGLQRELTADALSAGGLPAWQQAQAPALERAKRMLAEFAENKQADLAMLSVALRELRQLA